MKKTLIAAASALSIAFAMPAFAIEAGQTTQQSAPDFEQTKADYMKRLDERITSLQQQKTCVQKATDQNALGACWSQHKTEMKNQRGMGTQVPPKGQ